MKKLLALVLALVMSMSLVTISNAATFSDADEIDYSVAVDVMNKAGVLVGSDGKFMPKAELTRAQAAKIIAYLDLTGDVADALPAVKVFSDVPTNHWAAKFIAYCADAGYVSGVGDGKFDPDAKVTGYQFGKMLLCVLGYDQKIEEMTGSSWEIKVAKLMEKNDISKDVKKLGSAALTREEAAQYALNALKADMVDYDTKGTNITIGSDANIVVGASKATAVTGTDAKYAEINNDGAAGTTADPYIVQLGEKLYGDKLSLDPGTDSFNRPGKDWKWNNVKFAFEAKTPALTYTAGVSTDSTKASYKALKADLKNAGVNVSASDTFTAADNVSKFDGASVTPTTPVVNSVATLAALTGNGKTVEIYLDSNKDVNDVVVIEYVLKQVDDVTETSKTNNGSVYTTYTFDDATTGKVFSVDKDDEGDTAKLNGKIAEDDYVTVSKDKDGVWHVYPTTKVVGTQTAYVSGDSVTVGGTKYSLAAVTGMTASEFTSNGTKDCNLYLDQYGYAVKETAVESTVNYVVVDSIMQSGLANSITAKLVFADGTTKEAKIDKIVKANGSATGVSITATASNAYAGWIFKYVINEDGNYELTALTEDGVDVAVDAKATDTGRPSLSNGTPVYNNTVFVVKTKDGAKDVFKAYTGYASVPTVTYSAAVTDAYSYATKDGKAAFVYIDASANATAVDSMATSTYIYVIGSDATVSGTSGKEVYTYAVAKDTEATTVNMNGTACGVVATNGKGLYKVTSMTSDGKITGLVWQNGTVGSGPDQDYTQVVSPASASNGVLAGKTYDGSETVIMIDVDGSVRAGSADSVKAATTESIFYKCDSTNTNKLVSVYVILKNA